jgi:hypothetical protein
MADNMNRQALGNRFSEQVGVPKPKLTEIEALEADLQPFLANRTLNQLSRENLRTLIIDSGLNRSQVRALADAAKLEQETAVPAAFFYALARQNISLNKRTLFAREPEELRISVATAAAAGIISLPDSVVLQQSFDRLNHVRTRYLPLDQFGALAGINLSAENWTSLGERKIRSLQDIKERGGLRSIKGIDQVLKDEQIRSLEAHSILSTLPLEPSANQLLIESGIFNLRAFVRADKAQLAKKLKLDETAINGLQAIAEAHHAIMSLPVTDAVMAVISENNASRLYRRDSYPKSFTRIARSISSGNGCNSCDSCGSALSPAAYLVDLMDLILDTFRADFSTPEIEAISFPDLESLETRFRRPLGTLKINCDDIQTPVRQIEIANEVLERFIGYSRATIYNFFGDTDPFRGTYLYPYPEVLPQMFYAYLGELGIAPLDFQTALDAAYPAVGTADFSLLDQIAQDLRLSRAQLTGDFGITGADWRPPFAVIDKMPDVVRKVFTDGLDRMDATQFAAYQDAVAQSNTAIDRVQQRFLPEIRANLIKFALGRAQLAGAPPEIALLTTEHKLGNYLYIDLASDVCLMTTRIADAIEALQSFVDAFLYGREQPGYFLSFQDSPAGPFRSRWDWIKRYEIWHAAQMVFLYPENFMLPRARTDASPEFRILLDELDRAAGDDSAVSTAILKYREALINSIILPAPQMSMFENCIYHISSSFGLGNRDFRSRQETAYRLVEGALGSRLRLDEWYLYLPLAVAATYNAARKFELAMQWLDNILFPLAADSRVDFSFAPTRLVWWGFEERRINGYEYRENAAWLTDPFTPFLIARLRQGSIERHVIIQHVENLLDWADAEFTRDTGESINSARELYERALELLEYDEVPQEEACVRFWRQLQAQLSMIFTIEELRLVRRLLDSIANDSRITPDDIVAFGTIARKEASFEERLEDLIARVAVIESRALYEPTIAEILSGRKGYAAYSPLELFFDGQFMDGYILNLGEDIASATLLTDALVDRMVDGFCAPSNPTFALLRFRAETNLEKIRTCRNYAGMRRDIRIYGEGTDPNEAIQRRATGETLSGTAIPDAPPAIHRFSYLIERARYTVGVAQQLEALLLSAFEQEDQVTYNLILARQNLQVSQSQVTLQALHVKEAQDQVRLAVLQRERTNFQRQHFTNLIQGGLSQYESQALGAAWAAHDFAIAGAVVSKVSDIPSVVASFWMGDYLGGAAGILGSWGRFFSGVSQVNSLYSQARSMQATFERRQQEWEFQRDLAGWDYDIGEQGVLLAHDQTAISEQESAIAQLQAQHASNVVNYLGTKFLNIALWQWMGRLVRGYYREHLNFATVIARMAQNALEFERQESITIVSSYYGEQDQRDLLAAERLLTDINKLDQHRLITEQRKKEISKTFSLSVFDPIEMQRLRERGWMTFTIKLQDFDRDFPGHYLRLIKSITISIIALIPPVEGIHATLSNAGISRVMVGPPFDQPRVIQRQPESIALSIPSEGTGLFELRLDDPILLPFESSGVETTWTLEMPKGANQFDFGAIADVLFTVRYTALDDPSYRGKVLQQMGVDTHGRLRLGRTISYNIRQTFADEWYDLFNPEFIQDTTQYGYNEGKLKPPYEMRLVLSPLDFGPNEADHKMSRVSLAFRQKQFAKMPLEVQFRPEGSNTIYAFDGDYNWDIANPTTSPFALTAFTYQRADESNPWQGILTSLNTLKPFGTWCIKLKNGGTRLNGEVIQPADYPDIFGSAPAQYGQNVLDLEGLVDGLLAIAYEASVLYEFAANS